LEVRILSRSRINQQKVETKQAQHKRACFFILGVADVSFVDFQNGAFKDQRS